MNRFLTAILILLVMPIMGFGDTNALVLTNLFDGVEPLVFKGLINSRAPGAVITFARKPQNRNSKITITIGSRLSFAVFPMCYSSIDNPAMPLNDIGEAVRLG